MKLSAYLFYRHLLNKDSAQVSFSSPSQWLVNSLSQEDDSTALDGQLEDMETDAVSDEDKTWQLDRLHEDYEVKKKTSGKGKGKNSKTKVCNVKSKSLQQTARITKLADDNWLTEGTMEKSYSSKNADDVDSDNEKHVLLAQLHCSSGRKSYSKKDAKRKKRFGIKNQKEECSNNKSDGDVAKFAGRIDSPILRVKNKRKIGDCKSEISDCFGFESCDKIVSIVPLKEYVKKHTGVEDCVDIEHYPPSQESMTDKNSVSRVQNSQLIELNVYKGESIDCNLFKTPSLLSVASKIGEVKCEKKKTPTCTISLRSKESATLRKVKVTCLLFAHVIPFCQYL